MSEMELSLTPGRRKRPFMGYCAVGFGVAGIFVSGILFVPLAFACSLLSLIRGRVGWGVSGLLLTVIGFLTTPFFLLLVGMQALVLYLNYLRETIGIPPLPGLIEV